MDIRRNGKMDIWNALDGANGNLCNEYGWING